MSGMRECFVPRPGHVFAACDYAAMELRTWSQINIALLGHSRMAEVLNAGQDPHCMMAGEILGCSYDEAVARKKTPEGYDARQSAKAANFGFPGGMGPTRFVTAAAEYGVEITEYRAQQLKALWKATWPEAAEYLACIGRLAEADFVQVEQYRSGRFRGGLGYCDCANTFFQGLAADAAKAAGWAIARACYNDRDSVLFGSRPVLFVHDEFVLEVPEDIGHECAIELQRLMVAGAQPWCPDVRIEAEPTLMRQYSKKAEAIWVDGRLQPWSCSAL